MNRPFVIKGRRKYIKNYKVNWYYDHEEFWNIFNEIDKKAKIFDIGCGGGDCLR